MHCLSNELLIEAYEKSIELQLSDLFIQLIMEEINGRELNGEELEKVANIYASSSSMRSFRKGRA